MKEFCVHLVAGSPVSVVEVLGKSGKYEIVAEKYDFDFVVLAESGAERLRVSRDHILYVTTTDKDPVN